MQWEDSLNEICLKLLACRILEALNMVIMALHLTNACCVCVVTPCGLAESYRNFGGIYFLHLQGLNHINHEHEGRIIFRNVGPHIAHYGTVS
jgi:hypothetical protein